MPQSEPQPLLSLKNFSIAFGGVHAVEGVGFDVPAGTIVSLIGPNGAGKTTTLNGISGFVRATGSIRYKGVDLVRLPAYRRASLGIGRTFQSLQLFPSMNLLENVVTGGHARLGSHMILDMLRFPVLRREREAAQQAMEILERLGLEEYAGRSVAGLPLGIQKLAGVARALAAEPELLLLDEPAAGLAREEAEELGALMHRLRDEMGIAVLLVEHNMRLVMAVSDRVVVLDDGRSLAQGTPREISGNPAVIEAYLGAVEDQRVAEEVQDELTHRT